MKILGIETSCDETAAAIVENGTKVLSNIVSTSLKEHKKYGGIIPEIASRRQLESIHAVVEESLAKAKTKLSEIGGIAVTTHPGLIGSLLVGTSFAKGLSFSANIPLIPVDHIKAHIYANFIRTQQSTLTPKLPAIGLVVSGGHTNLYRLKSFTEFELLGQTLDDAVGEAFDKVARILDLGYPGGPAIDRAAKLGENKQISFKAAQLPGSLNFSFSGIKTAVLYHKQKNENQQDYTKEKVAFSFQQSVVKNIIDKSLSACKKYKINTLLIGGGVAANSLLREKLQEAKESHKLNIFFPPFFLCTDNAAMIAGYGYHLRKRGKHV